MNEPVTRKILRLLVDDGPMTSRELAARIPYQPSLPWQRRQSGINGYLHDLRKRGHTEVMGEVRAGRNVPAKIWAATSDGEVALTLPWPPPPSKTSHRMSQIRERAHAREIIAAMIERERKGRGRHTPPAERRLIVADWQRRGASYGQMAEVFGVSREQIRLDLYALKQPRQAS